MAQTDVMVWLVGLSKELKRNGFKAASKKIIDAIGPDGKGGIAKVIGDYNTGDNILDLGNNPLPLKLVLTKDLVVNGATVAKAGQEVNFSLDIDANPIIKGILEAVLGVLFLAE